MLEGLLIYIIDYHKVKNDNYNSNEDQKTQAAIEIFSIIFM